MTLTSGTRLGPYQITGLLGAGGMGEVYTATDTRLDRRVAVKILTPGLTTDPNARQRFAREARAIAGLTHPHICALYDIGQHDGADYLVMEYLDGETLAERLVRGALPLDQALRYAIEMAEALACAHEAGIVHRDLKPANVILTKSGAKLLDFGLAKLRDLPSVLTAATTSQPLTGQGATPGTPQYMAPEQVEGHEADARSDIFAFGVVLYEMLSGRKAFEARTQASLIARILEVDPPPLGAPVPPALEYLVRVCLAKAPDARWRSMHDVALQLRSIEQDRTPAAAGTVPTAPAGPRWLVAALAGLAVLLLLSTGVLLFRDEPPAGVPHARFDITLPERLGLDWPDWPVVSPAGDRLAFTARSEGVRLLWVRRNDGSVRAVPGTEGAAFAFWSPDGRRLGFFAGGKLRTVDADGGPVAALADGYSVGRGAWGRDGTILFVPRPGGPIHAVSDSGGTPRPVTRLDAARGQTGHHVLRFLPDGRRFLYATSGGGPAIYAASTDDTDAKEILRGATAATFAEPGYLLFSRGQTLMAQPFDAGRLQASGEPIPIAEHVAGSAFSASDEGTLVFRHGGSATQPTWYTRDGQRTGTVGPPAYFQQVALSPSGRRAAMQRIDPDTGNPDIWTLDLATGIPSRLTLDPALDADPVWSPDEQSIAFTTYRTGVGTVDVWDLVSGRQRALFSMAAIDRPGQSGAGAGGLTPLAPARIPEGVALDDWAADGTLVVRTFGRAVFAVPPGPKRGPVLLADTPYVEDQSQVSPDGRMIAFNSDESGRWEVYVATFPAFTQKRQISSTGGMQPRWSRDGRELFYLGGDGAMMVAAVGLDQQPTSSVPRRLFQTRLSPSPSVPQYDVRADGSRFLVLEPSAPNGEPITFVLNWTRLLE